MQELMAELEHWGKKYHDKQNRPEYNKQPVTYGTLCLLLEFVGQWDQSVNQADKNKRGHPLICPLMFIEWMACIHSIFQMPYRQMEGFTPALSKILPGVQSADYPTLFRRIQQMPLDLPEVNKGNEDVVIAVDSTGIKVTNRGEWMREMGRIHRGLLPQHVPGLTQKSGGKTRT